MTHHIEQTIKVNVPAAKIWQVMGDYSSVEKFATTIKSSPIVSEISSGIGAKRKCTFNDGSSLVEEVTQYQEGEGFTMELSEHALPLRSMSAQMRVREIDSNSSELFMSADFVVKGGPFGWLLGFLVMRPIMKGVFKKVMGGLAYHTLTGERIGEKLPSDTELAKVVLS